MKGNTIFIVISKNTSQILLDGIVVGDELGVLVGLEVWIFVGILGVIEGFIGGFVVGSCEEYW